MDSLAPVIAAPMSGTICWTMPPNWLDPPDDDACACGRDCAFAATCS